MSFHCHACGWESIPPPHVAVVFHPCAPLGRRRRMVKLPPVEDTTREEIRTRMWEGFRAALPGEALLRPLDDDGEEG